MVYSLLKLFFITLRASWQLHVELNNISFCLQSERHVIVTASESLNHRPAFHSNRFLSVDAINAQAHRRRDYRFNNTNIPLVWNNNWFIKTPVCEVMMLQFLYVRDRSDYKSRMCFCFWFKLQNEC